MARQVDILISSAGRRVALMNTVRSIASRTLATDMNPHLSPACQVADIALAVPPISASDYLSVLHQRLLEHEVDLVIPTIDTELLPLSRVREAWRHDGIVVSVGDEGFISACRDKRLTAALFASLGIETPTSLADNTTFPRFIKPVSGSRSVDLHIASAPSDLSTSLLNEDDYVHQELVDRDVYDEYTVDIYYRADGSAACIVPRLRIEVRDGEISKGRTAKGPLVDFLWKRMGKLPGARGCVAAQFFVARDWARSDRPVLGIEINPRFGGGYPLTDAAGGTYVRWLVDEYLNGQDIERFDDWTDGLLMLRYDAAVYVP